METIVINHKMYEIKPSLMCTNCMFHNNETNNITCNEKHWKECYIKGFIFIREIKLKERIKLWFKKKIKESMIINGIKVELKEVDEPTCNGCVFDNNGNCTADEDKQHCSVYSIYVKSKK